MRSEKEMYDLIMQTAIDDERILAVTIFGSRANKNADIDIFSDYDICYVVEEMESFVSNEKWLSRFGEFLIWGTPLETEVHRFYLMQFMDGNRIDLNIYPKELAQDCVRSSLSAVLLDKKNLFPQINEASDRDFHIKKPTASEFTQTCFIFWCTCLDVAKGLWRNELLYTLGKIDKNLRPDLMIMLDWYIGVKHDFAVSTGKNYKYLNRFLSDDIWRKLLSTYTTADSGSIWGALFTMCELFSKTAAYIADNMSFEYKKSDETNVVAYIKHVANLPQNEVLHDFDDFAKSALH